MNAAIGIHATFRYHEPSAAHAIAYAAPLTTSSAQASLVFMRPAGSSRFAVRGLRASSRRSTRRLIASAEVRAPTAATRIVTHRVHGSAGPVTLKMPARIKGSENRVCSKRTNVA